MRSLKVILAGAILGSAAVASHAQTIFVDHFHKVTVSPYIQATFIEGSDESVTINNALVDAKKLHVEVHGETLRIYLDGAKDFPKNLRGQDSRGDQQDYPLYPDHALSVTISYRDLDAISLRGAETYLCKSPISTNSFTIRLYGEAKVTLTKVEVS